LYRIPTAFNRNQDVVSVPKIKKCALCGYEWKSRKANPVSCPRCKSYNYNGVPPTANSEPGNPTPTTNAVNIGGA